MKLNQSRKQNHEEVVEEDMRLHNAKAYALQQLAKKKEEEKKRKQELREEEEALEKERQEQEAEAHDDDANQDEEGAEEAPAEMIKIRVHQRDESADQEYMSESALSVEGKQKKRRRADKNRAMDGHSRLWVNRDASVRAYHRRCKNVPLTQEMYDEMKRSTPAHEFYRGADSLCYTKGPKVSAALVDRLVEHQAKDEERKSKFHRRREFYEEEEVDYIHEGNRLFNKKLDKAFGKYTAEIKANLERGTAL
eukprot:gnl/Trimastix_PCT/1655.p1 GENE.gnl/Trimastix_PCT/1655~~gnl/Trimastix_PCT/1655.p1  ORF type:complete len:287 (+),score=104.84 gnl/Trimastix_PCT/1655:110-862(+)